MLRERPVCEMGARIGWPHCTVRSTEVHEVLARSAGGSILDEANCMTACHTCHEWTTTHPAKALEIGLRRSRYNR